MRTGDWITLDVPNRRVDADVPAGELDRRDPAPALLDGLARAHRGWQRLYIDTVMGADTGADLDFLAGSSGDAVTRESH